MYKDNKKLVVESLFIKEALKKDLSLDEFLLLLYFDNSFDSVFDPDTISKVICIDTNRLIEAYGSLMKKKLICVKAEKDGYGKVIEKVYADNFYNDIKIDSKSNEKVQEKEDIFSKFESGFGRTLSAMDYEIINAWIDKGFSEDMICAALKEAVVNGVANLRYIDKILYEWNRKGIKKPQDIVSGDDDSPMLETTILNFDWLNEH